MFGYFATNNRAQVVGKLLNVRGTAGREEGGNGEFDRGAYEEEWRGRKGKGG